MYSPTARPLPYSFDYLPQPLTTYLIPQINSPTNSSITCPTYVQTMISNVASAAEFTNPTSYFNTTPSICNRRPIFCAPTHRSLTDDRRFTDFARCWLPSQRFEYPQVCFNPFSLIAQIFFHQLYAVELSYFTHSFSGSTRTPIPCWYLISIHQILCSDDCSLATCN